MFLPRIFCALCVSFLLCSGAPLEKNDEVNAVVAADPNQNAVTNVQVVPVEMHALAVREPSEVAKFRARRGISISTTQLISLVSTFAGYISSIKWSNKDDVKTVINNILQGLGSLDTTLIKLFLSAVTSSTYGIKATSLSALVTVSNDFKTFTSFLSGALVSQTIKGTTYAIAYSATIAKYAITIFAKLYSQGVTNIISFISAVAKSANKLSTGVEAVGGVFTLLIIGIMFSSMAGSGSNFYGGSGSCGGYDKNTQAYCSSVLQDAMSLTGVKDPCLVSIFAAAQSAYNAYYYIAWDANSAAACSSYQSVLCAMNKSPVVGCNGV